MSEENLKQFMSKVADSEELQAKIDDTNTSSGMDTEALIALGAECGCEFNAEDWIQMCKVWNRAIDTKREYYADRRRGVKPMKRGELPTINNFTQLQWAYKFKPSVFD